MTAATTASHSHTDDLSMSPPPSSNTSKKRFRALQLIMDEAPIKDFTCSLGRTGTLAAQPEIREVDDLDGPGSYPVLMGDYQPATAWSSAPIVAGTAIEPPTPVFTKLDTSVVADELARLEEAAGA